MLLSVIYGFPNNKVRRRCEREVHLQLEPNLWPWQVRARLESVAVRMNDELDRRLTVVHFSQLNEDLVRARAAGIDEPFVFVKVNFNR
jgi:hypothetical protein